MSPSPEIALIRIDVASGTGIAHPRHRHPALDLKYIAAGIHALTGREPSLIDLCAADIGRIGAPAIAIIKGASGSLADSVATAATLRQRGSFTIAVGQQVAHVAKSPHPRWHQAYDLAIHGDPEAEAPRVVAELLAGGERQAIVAAARQRLDHGEMIAIDDPDALPGFAYSADELARFPFPFPLPGPRLARWAYLLTAWGCPRACRHCSAVVRKSSGSGLAKRQPAAVVDELARHLDAGAEAIAFEDDSLFVDRRHFLALCDAIARRGLRFRWIANARPDELDGERVGAASATGALALKVGVDSGSPRIIERIGKSADGERWLDDCEAAFTGLARARIGSVGLFVVGLPGETVDDIAASMALARRLAPSYIQVQMFTPYPDVPMWREIVDARAATLAAESPWHYRLPASGNGVLTPAEIARQQARFYRRYYLSPAFLARHLSGNWRHYLRPATLREAAAGLAYVLAGTGRAAGTTMR